MGRYFGTDGFRGEVNKDLTADHAYRIGRFLGWYYREKEEEREKEKEKEREKRSCRVVIGKDTRRSSYMFEYALAAGLTASGADAYLLHVTTTPSVSYITRTDQFDCGVMITASHNPYTDNGIKLINRYGEKMEEAVVEQVEDYIDGKFEIPLAVEEKVGVTVDYIMGRNRYAGYVVSLSQYSFKGIRVGLDCANGSSWTLAKTIFDALGAITYMINNRPDGLNVNRNCGSTNVESLRKLVLKEKLDIGFAFDGDADRCIGVDDKGNEIDGDTILYVCARYLQKKGMLARNTVVTTVMSNIGLYKAFDEAGILYEQTDVGDKNVYESMSKNGYCLGGENSGHIIFGKVETTGDGIVTALKVMEAMIDSKKKMSDLASPLKKYPQKLVNLCVTDKKAVMEDEGIKDFIREESLALGDSGRVLVRKSGTEPIVRVMVEAKTEWICKRTVDRICNAIEKKGYVYK